MERVTASATASFPTLGVLTIVFVTLKLCGVIAWSWWWVLLPFWGPYGLVLAIVVLALLFYIGLGLGDRLSKPRVIRPKTPINVTPLKR